ncbi:hypothetical protein DFH28DRAFT_1096251 [Melampsora americana]|nr:hypothetical protein DFH28DRAFT_1096251 [Melampsora americana]
MLSRLPLRSIRSTKPNHFLIIHHHQTRPSTHGSPQLISTTSEISIPNSRTAYDYKVLDQIDPQLDGLHYPRIQSDSRQWRNPYAQWDDPQERCNFDEPLHAEEEMMGIWAPDVHRISPSHALLNLSIAFSVLAGIMSISSSLAPSSPVVPREFPYDGLCKELGGEDQRVCFD